MRILRLLPLTFVLVAPVLWIGAFYLSNTSYENFAGFSNYPVYALAVTGMWLFLLTLLVRSPDGKGSVLLVSMFYETGFFALTLWAISVVALFTIFGYGGHLSISISRSFVSSSAGASIVAVVAVYGAWRGDLLWERIHPWPLKFKSKKRRVK